MEYEPQPQFTIAQLTAENVDAADDMRRQSWLDTYVNDEAGVTREWIEARNAARSTPEARQRRREQIRSGQTNGWVALNERGEVIGVTNPWVDNEGRQKVGSLYVDKRYHGSGVASQLMQCVIDWFDSSRPIELGVVSYNERAKAFYRKWGFEEVPGSEDLFDGKIPEIKMVRRGDAQGRKEE